MRLSALAAQRADLPAQPTVQQLLDEEFATMHEWVAVLSARRAQDEASLRAAMLQWADQSALLRSEILDLREEHVNRAAQLHRLNSEQMLVLEQLTGRMSKMQSQLGDQERRIRRLVIVVTTIVLTGAAAVMAGHFLV